jgi:cyclopropane-fatty-acyl-phospholipid synthase
MTTIETAEAKRTSLLTPLLSPLAEKAGIIINGPNPWDPQVRNPRAFRRTILHGTLGLGEAYMDGDWYAKDLEGFFVLALSEGLDDAFSDMSTLWFKLISRITNRQRRGREEEVATHYNAGNDLFEGMLDRTMTYTCAYYSSPNKPNSLYAAQIDKLELICTKLGLKGGERILDIGCGWGGFARYAAERHGARVVGITIADKQLEYAREHNQCEGVEFRKQDYRDVREEFDHVVSVEMIEAVGPKNLRTYFEVVKRCLKPRGLFLLQAIVGDRSSMHTDPWLDKYIFPNGVLPSRAQIDAAVEGLLVEEDAHNFGADYALTLRAWHKNLTEAWPKLSRKYGDRFYRMMEYYLLSCAAGFTIRRHQDVQFVYSNGGVLGGYERVTI